MSRLGLIVGSAMFGAEPMPPGDVIVLQRHGSAFEDERGHLVAGFDPAWHSRLLEAWRRSAGEPLGDGGTYWQAIGPRSETPAEIRLIAPHADVVGMTLASECIVACELGLPCAVDNLANGIGGPLSAEEFEAGQSANRARLEALVPALVAELGSEAAA